MSKLEQTLAKAKSRNLVDDRNAMIFANAKTLPNGEFGLCLLCVNGNTLEVRGTDFSQNIGETLYRISLNRISNVKNSTFLFNRSLKFDYDGGRYHFCDYGDARRFMEVVLEESVKGS